MDNTFTLKCNNCGKETIVFADEKGWIEFNNKFVSFYTSGYGGEVGIRCGDCDNSIEE